MGAMKRNVLMVLPADHGTGFTVALSDADYNPSEHLYFSDWDEVQHAFANDLGLLRFLRDGEYKKENGDNE